MKRDKRDARDTGDIRDTRDNREWRYKRHMCIQGLERQQRVEIARDIRDT